MFHFAGVRFRRRGGNAVSDEKIADDAVFFIDGGSVNFALFGQIEMLAVFINVIFFAKQFHGFIHRGLGNPEFFRHFDAVHEGQLPAQQEDAFEIVLFRLIALFKFAVHKFPLPASNKRFSFVLISGTLIAAKSYGIKIRSFAPLLKMPPKSAVLHIGNGVYAKAVFLVRNIACNRLSAAAAKKYSPAILQGLPLKALFPQLPFPRRFCPPPRSL